VELQTLEEDVAFEMRALTLREGVSLKSMEFSIREMVEHLKLLELF
jgi:hypothetical protein